MKNKLAPACLALAALLALTGCGGAASSGSTSASSSTPSPSPTPTPTPKTYTNEDLAAIVAGLKDAQGQPLTVIPAAQLNQGMITAKQMLKSAVISPAACNVLADNNSQIPEGSTYAGGTSQSAVDKTATIVTVFAVKDPQVMTNQLDKSAGALAQCATFTVEAAGQKITSRMQALDAKTAGDKSVGVLATQTLPTGQKQTMVTVTGVKGTLAATAVKAGATLTADSAPELVQLVNAVLAKG